MKHLLLLLLLLLPLQIRAQEYEGAPYNGQILDIQKRPMKNVRVWINDNQKDYAITNKRGYFSLPHAQEGDTLKLFYKKSLYFIPTSGKRAIRIHFWRDFSGLSAEEASDLLEMGYGQIRKVDSSSSENHITGEELVQTGLTDLLDALQGRIPGLNIQTSMLGTESQAKIHGITSIVGSSEPLYIVDGMILSSLTGYTVYQVDYVEILKDASIYGAQGANGAIIVKTKRD